MIFDTQGTGFYKKAVRQMMAQEEIPYLSGLSGQGGGLGDEIMLLEGLDDLGAMYPHGDDDGPARTHTMPTSSDGTLYDFSTGPVETGMSGANLGASVNSNQGAWPRGGNPSWNYTGLGAGWPRQQSRYLPRTYRYTGLQGASIKRGRYAYTGLMSLGDAQSDARTAMMIAETTKSLGLAAAGAITDPGQRAATIAGINAAYAAARIAIVASYGTDGTTPAPAGTPPPSQAVQEQIDAKLRLQAQRSGVDPAVVDNGGAQNDSGLSTNTMLIGGAVIVALLAGVYIMKKD